MTRSFGKIFSAGAWFLLFVLNHGAMDRMDFEAMRTRMVQQQLKNRDISDERVLEVMQTVPRHRFVPEGLAEHAYDDGPLEIGYGQTISQPYIVAYMTQALEVQRGDRILEIGTGSGYQAAVLAEMGARVFSVEIVEPLFREVSERLYSMGYHQVQCRLGDGWQGWPEEAPFDKIIVTAAPDRIPEALVEQLKDGGRMMIPVGDQGSGQDLILGVKENGVFKKTRSMAVRFVPLVKGADE